jgi:lipoprotein-releasing system ATP-binding protein
LSTLSALENVALPLRLQGLSKKEAEGTAKSMLGHVGLTGRITHRPDELSGGERQRVAIARALVNGPPLMLCDEPTGNLDRQTGEAVADLFIELARQRQVMLLVVTHNLDLAGRFSRRLELRDGLLQS